MTLYWSILVILAVAEVHSVEVAEEVYSYLRQIQTGELGYAIYRIVPEQNLLIKEFAGPREASFADFVRDLRKTNPAESRFGVVNFKYIEADSPRKTIVAFLWSPKNGLEEEKRTYIDTLTASFESAVVPKMYGITSFLIANVEEDLNLATLSAKIQDTPTVEAPQTRNVPSNTINVE